VQLKVDIYIRTAERGVHTLLTAGVPSTFLVNTGSPEAFLTKEKQAR
jgi:hypothetical protein